MEKEMKHKVEKELEKKERITCIVERSLGSTQVAEILSGEFMPAIEEREIVKVLRSCGKIYFIDSQGDYWDKAIIAIYDEDGVLLS